MIKETEIIRYNTPLSKVRQEICSIEIFTSGKTDIERKLQQIIVLDKYQVYDLFEHLFSAVSWYAENDNLYLSNHKQIDGKYFMKEHNIKQHKKEW